MKVAIVSGAASGIGQALCRLYAERGIKVVGGFYERDPHDPEETVRLVRAAGGECAMVQVDVSSTEQSEAFVQAALARYGQLNYVAAVAGLIRGSSLAEMTDAHWSQMIEVNLSGVARIIRAASRVMADDGAIVAVSSFLGSIMGWQDYSAYSAAKAGVVGFCRSVAIELAPRGIRCNTVIPGLIETPQTLDAVNSVGPSGLARMAPTIPFRRVGRAEEVASLIRYLTSEESAYITGQEIACDGGLTTVWNGGK